MLKNIIKVLLLSAAFFIPISMTGGAYATAAQSQSASSAVKKDTSANKTSASSKGKKTAAKGSSSKNKNKQKTKADSSKKNKQKQVVISSKKSKKPTAKQRKAQLEKLTKKGNSLNSRKKTAKNTVSAPAAAATTVVAKSSMAQPSTFVVENYSDAENPLLPLTDKLKKQRRYFQDAKTAVKKGDAKTALYIKNNFLSDYPLAIWVDYWYLATDPHISKYKKAKEFIDSKKHQELAELLRTKYIDYLSHIGQFKKVSDLIGEKPFSDESSLTQKQRSLQCRYYEARWQRGIADASASAFATRMYLNFKPYPQECGGLIYLWSSNGYLNEKMRREKFERLYITRNYADTTKSMALSMADTSFATRIMTEMNYYDDPSKVVSLEPKDEDTRRAGVLIFKRYANLDPKNATPQFADFSKKFSVTDTEKLEIFQIIAKGFLGRQSTEDEVAWVDKYLPAVVWSEDIKLMRMRRAIWFSQWHVVYDLYDHLSDTDKSQINWRYWKARSAKETGRIEESAQLLEEVAKDRSFFGFLAAQECGKALPFNHVKLSKDAHWPDTVKNNQAAIRFFEFQALNDNNASIEWREIAKTGTDDEAMLMSEWALSTGNIGYAISSVIAGQRWSALDYRFPKPYLNLYKKYSYATKVPISFLYGISRQESMLNPTIKSPVGAVGLMQLMPNTAKMVAKKNSWSYSGDRDLTIPDNNIRLGAAYIKDMLDRFDNNRILAAAAYNAGPSRIKIWKSTDGRKRDPAMYIENIPFKETRLYVQNVLLYDVIYNKLLTGQEEKLLKAHERKYSY